MQRLKFYLLPLLVLLLGGYLVFFLFTGKQPPQAVEPEQAAALPVRTMPVTVGDTALTVVAQGTVEPRQEIDLVAEVAGKVEFVAADFVAGGFFSAGEALLKVEAADYEIAKIQAQARVAEAEELLATTRGQARFAKEEWRDLGDKTANDLFLRKPQLARATAQVAAAKAQARKANLDLGRTNVSAPFSGRVRETYADLGQYLGPGQRIAKIYSTDIAQVRLPLTDRQVSLLNLPLHSDAINTRLPLQLVGTFAGQQWRWPANIVRTEAAIDPQSRVLYAVAEVANPYQQQSGSDRPPLTIGQYVSAEIQGKTVAGVSAIPRSALRDDNTVWLLGENERLEVSPVEIVQLNADTATVRGLPANGAQLITSRIPLPVAGMALQLDESNTELKAQVP